MKRSRGYFREQRHKAISRKKEISKQIYGFDWYNVDGRYDKGKIYCGCGICKYCKKFDIPTLRSEREHTKFSIDLKDYYGENNYE